jgi:hypothetical protein
MCAGVTDYYKQEFFLKGVAQGGAGGSSGASEDDATSYYTWKINVKEYFFLPLAPL